MMAKINFEDAPKKANPFIGVLLLFISLILLVSKIVKTMHFSAFRFQLLKRLSLVYVRTKSKWS